MTALRHQPGPSPPIPARPTLTNLRRAVQDCRACELWQGTTQAVMGEGARRAEVMLVGEQPGDREDREGHPYRWHVSACLPWLRAELQTVKPRALVLLGSTAAQGLLGPKVRIGRDRGVPLDSDLAELVTLTTHPSAILRSRDEAGRGAALAALIDDLRMVAEWLSTG